jgi:hypothetical protein
MHSPAAEGANMKRRKSRASVSTKVRSLRAKIKATEARLARLLTELERARALLSREARRRKH